VIAIENVLLSDDIIEAEFVCDLEKCKGGCCVEGDCGAPLTDEETKIINEIYPTIKPLLLPSYIKEIELQGTHVIDSEHGAVTPTVEGGICVYALTDEQGIVKCAIEKAYNEGLVDFKKPISCHLYPIRIATTDTYDIANYEPRKKLCRPACKLGKKLEVPVYQFLKEPLIRKYGIEFYEALDATAQFKKSQS
jgi:hypothetical protein